MRAEFEGNVILVGNEKLMQDNNISYDEETAVGTVVYVAKNGTFLGSILIADTLKEDTISSINKLKKLGISTTMLTGDSQKVGKSVADELGIDYKAELLPSDKVSAVEQLLKTSKGTLAFVGDGINDAPVLARADIGIAMGGMGSDAAIEAADIVIMNDEISKIPLGIAIAKKTRRIVKQNIAFSLIVKAIVLILGATGLVGMWAAVLSDVVVAFIAILNATRCLKTKNL